MANDRPYWDMQIEPFFNTPEMKFLQFEKLKIMFKRMYSNAPFYRVRFDAAGINIDKES